MFLTDGLRQAAQARPGAAATVFGNRVRTFAELADRVPRLAGALRGLGVDIGDRVAMLALNSDRYHEYLLATAWAGAVVNPVNTRWSPAEILYSLQDSETKVLLVDDTCASRLPDLRQQLTTVIHAGDGPTPAGTLSYEDLIATSAPIEPVPRDDDELAGVFYTGGTTGFPKGVRLSHTNLLTSARGLADTGYLDPVGMRYLHVAPMFHLADLILWNTVTMLGGTHVILPGFDPTAVLAAIAERHVTDVVLVPTMIQLLVDYPTVTRYDLSSLRTVIYGASPIPQAVLERAMKALPGIRFIQGYGMTELSAIATLLGPEDHHGHLLRSAGRAAPHSELRVVAPDDNEVPRGTVGEIVVRGAHVMRGYWNKPAETAAAIRDGWMHTGDAGYMDDAGYVFIVDRLKDMIVTGGENVYSVEVENAIARHPAVASCAVIGVPDPDWGERVHAVVVLSPGKEVTAEAIREHTKTLIAGYKAPRTTEFVDHLPVSAAGKILKRELRKKYWTDALRQVH